MRLSVAARRLDGAVCFIGPAIWCPSKIGVSRSKRVPILGVLNPSDPAIFRLSPIGHRKEGWSYPKEQMGLEGERQIYERDADSGYRIRFHFCPNCGSTL
jgi:hypothetical protein